MARYICEMHKKQTSASDTTKSKLIIYEMGPGTGALAESILDYVKMTEPFLYRTMEYHMIEISPSLHAAQIQRFKSTAHYSKIRFSNKSFFHVTEVEPRECFVLGFEVLVSSIGECFREKCIIKIHAFSCRIISLMIESSILLMEL